MIDINVEIDPDLLGIDEKESINIYTTNGRAYHCIHTREFIYSN